MLYRYAQVYTYTLIWHLVTYDSFTFLRTTYINSVKVCYCSTQQSQGTYSSGTESSIGKSFKKYSDAVQLGIIHSSSYNMGRALLLKGDHETALDHLKTALGIKPIHMETRCALY